MTLTLCTLRMNCPLVPCPETVRQEKAWQKPSHSFVNNCINRMYCKMYRFYRPTLYITLLQSSKRFHSLQSTHL